VHEYIRDFRKDQIEDELSGTDFCKLKEYVPPCTYEAATYGNNGYKIEHRDPVEGRGLPACPDEVKPYSTFTTPYRWMREDQFADICAAEGLHIRSSPSGKEHGWVTEDDRQRALLKAFWQKIERTKSLVFYYCKDGNAVDDGLSRLIVGVGRIKEVGDQVFFGAHPKLKGQFPVWARQITQAWPAEGVRIPYQDYLDKGLDPSPIACIPPPQQQFRFSYVAEHLTDGVAAMVLDRIIRSVERVAADGHLPSFDAAGALTWLNGALDEVWSGRGAYPGIGSLLRALGFEQGIHYQYTVLSQREREEQDPWHYVRSILNGLTDEPKAEFRPGLAAAGEKWRLLSSRHELLDSLVRFELTTDQFLDLLSEVDRVRRGIVATGKDIIQNPYLLCEQDHGTDGSEPISLEVIDQGARPEGAAARFGNPWMMPQDDKRRVRAVALSVLNDAAGEGHTFLPVAALIGGIRSHFPERRECRPDEEVTLSQRDFFECVVTFDEIDDVPIAATRVLRERENSLSELFKRMAPKEYVDAPAVDWGKHLTSVVGEPNTDREIAAFEEKQVALEVLYRNRLSILTGGAGVGKTKALQAFVQGLIEAEGMQPLLLLAPTGKARVRLGESTKRRANTIHQILRKQKLIGPRLILLDRTNEPPQRVHTVIIDEASMPSVDLLACLFKAVDTNAIRRLIFVGDPAQLPPIGPGRPFSELIEWLDAHAPSRVARLATCMRTVEVGGKEAVSPGLELAGTFRDEATPGDDAILARLAKSEQLGDLEIAFWNTPDELRELLHTKLGEHEGVIKGDYKSFNRSLGFDTEDWKRAEAWQILCATRGEPYGTVDLNRLIQQEFRGAMLAYARNPSTSMPRPFGDEEIVRGDKIINIKNDMAYCKPQEHGLGYLANGEIGLATKAYSTREYGDKLLAAFTTQPKTVYYFGREDARERLELAYALTVHKAQGSDFGKVFFVLPQESRTLSRELLYTGLTRFQKAVVILAERDISPLLRLRAADMSDARQRCSRLFKPYVPLGIFPADDPRTPYYADRLKHRTGEGVKVRSKSEVIVAYALEKLELRPEYEVPLYAKDGDKRDFRLPDFTILHDGETWYWEHLGMLSVPKYRADWEAKEAWYKANGYWDRVVVSQDNPDGSIHADQIEATARETILAS
jgi:hypothetical protein